MSRAAWAGPAALLALGLALTAATWLRWSDPWIDLGTELYVPWRLAEGDRLYADLAYRNGPLSPALNALLFRVFGVSLRTLVLCNLALLALASALLYRLLTLSADRLGAFVATAFFLVAFGFGHLVSIGNFNWVTPYQHSQTHGVLAILALVLVLARSLRGQSGAMSLVSGLFLGLVFLTKVELFAGALAAQAAASALLWLASRREALRHLAAALVGAGLTVGAAWAALAGCIGPDEALRGVLGNWVYLGANVAEDPFYRFGLGIDAPGRNAVRGLLAAAVLAGFTLLVCVADRSLRVGTRGAIAAGASLFVLGLLVDPVSWLRLARALPLVCLTVGGLLAIRAFAARRDRAELARVGALVVWAASALALLAKMPLHARIQHYGFTLAMPATVLGVVALVSLVPRWLEARADGAAGRLARAASVGLVLTALVGIGSISANHYVRKTFRVGPGRDAILTEPARGRLASEALERLGPLLPEGATLLVLPEGAILNYWLRRENPSGIVLFLPTELRALGGEQSVLETLRQNPAHLVVFVERSFAEFDVGDFGSEPGAGALIADWVESTHRTLTPGGRSSLERPGLQIAAFAARSGSRNTADP